MKPQFLLFTSLMFTAFAVKSQNYIDLAKFDYAVTSTNTFDTGTATTPLMEMNGDLTVPVVINEKFTFLPGVTYENTKASFDPGRATESITGLTLKLGMNINHNENN